MTNFRNLFMCPTCGEVWLSQTGRYCVECRTEGEPLDEPTDD